MSDTADRIRLALGAMTQVGPRDLRAYLKRPGPDLEDASAEDIELMIDMLLASDPNAEYRLLFSNLLRSWDNSKDAKWIGGTVRNSPSRRRRIHERLGSDASLEARIDSLIPFFNLDEPLLITTKLKDWYTPTPGVRDYYWRTYARYLSERRGLKEEAIIELENSTRAVVECLGNPESKEAFQSRGLVMGYVQSGKTAHFIGVVARAADAGYRLVIVLAGTWNILRNQTQRRFDKELLGKELLSNDESYVERPPSDWDEFLEHGTDPIELGHYGWQRMTRPDIDLKRLRQAIDNLEFERRDKARPVYDPTNLHHLPVKLLVIKKNSGIIKNLIHDLRLVHTRLSEIPALVIDDESDQAGINVIDPRKFKKKDEEKRSSTNAQIVKLLNLLERAQYVGYTATPYANALVNPNDPADLFPRHFILSLPRPYGYMGISDFFDPLKDFEDLDSNDYSLPEIAFIRRVGAPQGKDDEDLKAAIRSYVLAGAVKLFRLSKAPQRYSPKDLKHHTMLVHTTHRTDPMGTLAEHIGRLWLQCALNAPRGERELDELWQRDFEKVCVAQAPAELRPRSFEELVPHLSEAIKRIEKGPRVYLVINSDSADAPDFSGADPVWKIVVGGNKLSRGYTIEGLTVSYYRRVAGAADTLMQMGRWFGFRPGYRDLVRVFLGVQEGKKGDSDLVSLFKEVCLMEERFRDELKRYVRQPGAARITPLDIPPLISVCGSLPPAGKNKMFNAILKDKNFGGRWSMLTLTPTGKGALDENVAVLKSMVAAGQWVERAVLGGRANDGSTVRADCVMIEICNGDLVSFLKHYRWLESEYALGEMPVENALQVDFLEKQQHGINSWLVVAPQKQESFGTPLSVNPSLSLSVKKRTRVKGRRFRVVGESAHRALAEYLADVRSTTKFQIDAPDGETVSLKNARRGVMLLYPIREDVSQAVSVGFELLFPQNTLGFDMHFTVIRHTDRESIVLDANTGP